MIASERLITERLVLRPIMLRDAPFFFKLIGNPQVRLFLGGPVPWSRRFAHFRTAFAKDHAGSRWIVETRSRGKPLGMVELSLHTDGIDIEISYQFDPEGWGFGHASEAVGCVIDHALLDLGLPRVIAETQSENVASCKLLERQGMMSIRRLYRHGAQQYVYATPESKSVKKLAAVTRLTTPPSFP